MKSVWSAYSSGLVFLRPITRLPSSHSPRLRSRSTRSKRLRTVRFFLPPPVEALKLLCCDIMGLFVKSESREINGGILQRSRFNRVIFRGMRTCERIGIDFYMISFGRARVPRMVSFTAGYLGAKHESCLFYSHS